MSWLYRFLKKSDDEQTVTVTAPAIQLTGDVTVTGALTQTGAVGVTGDQTVTGGQTVTGNQTVSGTSRTTTSPLYLGSGTLGVFFGSVIPWSTGVAGADKGSIYLNSAGTVFIKTDYASKSWSTASVTA